MNRTIEHSYYAVIPATVRYDKRLIPNAKLLYAEITSLCNKEGFCWATNRYFSELYNVRIETISIWINQLIKYCYLESKMIYKKGTKEILNRYLVLNGNPIAKKLKTPLEEILKDNNTSINNKSNIIESAIIAKVACGALENTPIVTVTNLSRTIDLLKKHNFWVIGLDGEKNNSDITNCNFSNNIAVIIGSEDKGLRRLTKEKCDIIARIDINNINSLNAAQAATIACYEMQRQRKNSTN